MKHHLLILLFFCKFLSLKGQDHIVTWNNDTLQCTFPNKPGKEGFRPSYKYENGHLRVIAYFPNDSVRVIEAGEIKSYSRKDHGKSLLCNGQFDAKQIQREGRKASYFPRYSDEKSWHFMRRMVTGKHATLYIAYWYQGQNSPAAYYFITRSDADPKLAVVLNGRKDANKFLSDADMAEQMKKVKYRKSRKGYIDIVNEYNRLKEELKK